MLEEATTVLTPARIFRYNGQTIINQDQDPGPEFTPQMILDYLKGTGVYPELSSAKIEIRQSALPDGSVQIEFVKAGTKGTQPLFATLAAIPPANVAAIRLYIEQAGQQDDLAEILAKAADIEKALVELDKHLGYMQRLVATCRALPAKPASELVLGI